MATEFLIELVGEKVKKELLAQVQDSITEETAAIDVYRRRADYARRGYPQIAKLYDHLREEEEHHKKELQDMAEKVRQLETKPEPRTRGRWPWKR